MKENKEIGSQHRTDSVAVFRSSGPSPGSPVSLEINRKTVLSQTITDISL